jgi:excisionase family DNA binding protein
MQILAERPVLPPTDAFGQRELDAAAELLAKLPETWETPAQAAIVAPDGTILRLPPAVYEVLAQVITAMRAGRAVTVAPIPKRMTTQEAADFLGVSRPTFVKLLDEGKIPFEQPISHRRVKLVDVLAYQKRRKVERSAALQELVRLSEELGLYDDELEGEA